MNSTSSTRTEESINYDEVYMQESMLFSRSLKDLRTIRKQLYRAAEYFESSYNNDPELLDISECNVVDVLKEYAIKALVNTVDHLGFVTNKVNNLLDDQVDKVSGTEFRLSSVEQRLRTFHDFIDWKGCSQHSMSVNTPNYHKRYILPVGETLHGAFRIKSKYEGCTIDDVNEWHQYKNAIQAKVQQTPQQIIFGKSRSPSPNPELSLRQNRVPFSDHLPNRNARPPSPAPVLTRQQNRVTFSNDLPNIERREPSPYRYMPPHSSSNPKGMSAVDPNTLQPIAPSQSMPTTPSRSRPTTPSRSRQTTPSWPSPTIAMSPNRVLTRQQYTSEVQNLDSMLAPVNEDHEQQKHKTKARIKAFINRYKAKIDDHMRTL